MAVVRTGDPHGGAGELRNGRKGSPKHLWRRGLQEGRAELAMEWFEQLEAPAKDLRIFPNSGHTPHLDEPSRFHDYMVDTVLAESAPGQ